MAFPNTVKVNFGGGELSPQMQSRADLEIYRSGLRALENFFITQTAGVRKREGWETVIEEIDLDELNVPDARLVPMVRPDGSFSLLIFGWATIGDNERDVVCFSETNVAPTIVSIRPSGSPPFRDVDRLGPLHFLTTTAAPPPAVPTEIRCEAGNGFVRLHWRTVPGATDYDYRYKLATSSTWTEINTAGDIGTGTTVTIGDGDTLILTNDAEYEFEVRSRNADDESDWSDPITCAPSQVAPITPPGLDVTAPPECGLRVTWDEVDGATQYQVRMRSAASPVAPWDESHEFMWQNGPVRRINTVLAGERYEIQVRARNAEFSSWSPSEDGTPVCGQPPGVPQAVEVEIVDADSVDLSWERVEGATFYVWQTWPGISPPFGRLPRGDRVEQDVGPRITVRIDNLGPEAMHTFRVRSAHHPDPTDLSGLTVSDWSVTATLIAVPATPENVSVAQSGPFRTITWDESAGATEYILRREWRNIFQDWVGTEVIYRGPETSHIHFDDGFSFVGFNDLRFSVAARNERGRSDYSNWFNDPLGAVSDTPGGGGVPR